MNTERFPVAILAGGLATRLRPITSTIPKSLVDVNGEPFVFHQLRLLRSKGVDRVVICVGHLGDMIAEAVGDGTRFGLRISYSFDGPRLLGTAGAVKRALVLLGDRFFVLYGDSYLPCDFATVQNAFMDQGRLALMTVFRNEGCWDRSNVEYLGGRIRAYSKVQSSADMRHIDYGLGAFDRRAFDLVPDDEPFDLAALHGDLLRRGQLAAYEVAQRFYEVGSPEGLEEMRRYLARCAVGSREQECPTPKSI